MLVCQRVKTVTHVVELPNFGRIAFACMGYTAFCGTCRKFVSYELNTCPLGKTELTALPCDMFTDLYAATATL